MSAAAVSDWLLHSTFTQTTSSFHACVVLVTPCGCRVDATDSWECAVCHTTLNLTATAQPSIPHTCLIPLTCHPLLPQMSDHLDEEIEAPLSTDTVDINEAFLYLTLLLRQHQAIRQSQKELAALTASITHTLTQQDAAHARTTRAAQHTARMADIQSLISREYDCLHGERQRTVQRKRELLPRLEAMQSRLQAMTRVKQEMDREQRRMDERQQQLTETRELLELRRRKLIMQLSGVFNIVPLHSKKERERKRERDKQKKPLARYSLLRSKANPAAVTSPTPSPTASSSLSSSPPPAPTSLSLTSHIPPARYYKLHDSILPPFHQMLTFEDEKVSTALGYAVLCVSLISKWSAERQSSTDATIAHRPPLAPRTAISAPRLTRPHTAAGMLCRYALPLRYRLVHFGSRSVVWDECEGEGGGGAGAGGTGGREGVGVCYPLYGRGVESGRFEYAVYFLTQNVEFVLNERVLHWHKHVQHAANTLEKLKILMEGLMGLLQ